MVSFLALLAIQIGVIILMRLITPKAKRPKAQPFERPTSEDGAPIPKPFGMVEISGNLMLVKDGRVSEENDGARHRYWARIAIALGWGPIDVLFDILSDELSLSLQRPGRNQSIGGSEPITTVPFPMELTGDAPVKFNIAALDMFGGGDEEGGLNGEVAFYRGTDAQPLDPLVVYAYEEFASRYPHMAYIRFGTAPDEETTSAQGSDFHWTANNPTPKPISVVVGSYPHGLVDQAAALGITTYTNPRIGHDANPMEVIWECVTNRVWGKSEPPETFDIPNFIAKAERCLAEGKGISTVFVNQALDDFIDDVERHVRGMMVENPKTGLIQMQLLRADYVIAELPVLTKENTFDFRQHEGHFLDTLNQIEVRYRKFAGGQRGVFTDQLVTDNAVFTRHAIYFPSGPTSGLGVEIGQLTWYGPGRRMFNVSAKRTRGAETITLTYAIDYRFHADDGWFQFYSNPETETILPGDTLTVSYESAPTYSGFIDATVSAQNLANFQVTGSTRRESYDMPMFTQEILAQEYADFLKLMSGRKLAPITWNAHRNTSGLRAGDVVLANEIDYRLTNMPIRITRIGSGTPEAPALRFEGIEDVFGEQLGAFPFVPGHAVVSPGPVSEITQTVVVTCLGGASRIGIFATQPFNIEVIRADDEAGTNATTITPAGGVPYTTRFVDDPQTIGVTKWYRARLIWPGMTSGPLSDPVSCTAAAGTPSEPTDQTLTWVLSTSQTETEGTATLTIIDPQNRLLSVQRNSQAGLAVPTSFETIVAPYTGTVALAAPHRSYVTFRITYVGLDGIDTTEEAVATFNPVIPPPPVPTLPDAMGGIVILPFHTTLTRGAVFGSAETGFPPAEATELAEFGRRRIDAIGMDKCQGQIQISHPLPGGAQVRWQYIPAILTEPVEEDWVYLDGISGPGIAADAATAIPIVSPQLRLDPLARQDIVVRAVCVGGDSATPLGIKEMILTFTGGTIAGDPDDGGGGGAVIPPNTCQETTLNFDGIGDTAALEAMGWENTPDTQAGGGMTLDPTGGVNGSRAIRMDVMPGALNYVSDQRIELELELEPFTSYRLEYDLKFSQSWADDPMYSAGRYSFSAGLAGAGLNLWFGGVPAGGGSDAHLYVGEYKHVDKAADGALLQFITPASGLVTFIGSISSLLGRVSSLHHAYIDNIEIRKVSTGELVLPCLGGPDIYIPPDDPCDGSTVSPGSYETTAEFDEDWALSDNNDPDLSVTWTIDPTAGPNGGRAVKATANEIFRGGSVWNNIRYVEISGLEPATFYKVRSRVKTNWLVGEIRNIFDEYPQVGVVIGPDPAFLAAGSEAGLASAAAFNSWEEILSPQSASTAEGKVYIGFAVTNGYFASVGKLSAWFSAIELVKSSTNELVAPCSGGPTVPGDGGYYPPSGPAGPKIPPPDTGDRALTLMGYVRDRFGRYPPFYGVLTTNSPNTLVSLLTDMRSRGYRYWLDPVGHNLPMVNGTFSMSRWLELLERYAGLINWDDWMDVIKGIMLIDEPTCTSCWNISSPMQFSVLDSVMAKRAYNIFGSNFPIGVRASPTTMLKQGYTPTYIKVGYVQAVGDRTAVLQHGEGAPNVQTLMSIEQAAADQLGLRIFWGINSRNWNKEKRWITPAELREWGIPMARDQESVGVYTWAGISVNSYDAESDAHLRQPDFIAAWTDVMNAMTP